MKIGIFTQRIKTNYGGILQAFALQYILKEMGHEVWTEDREPNIDSSSLLKRLRLFASMLLRRKSNILTDYETEVVGQNTLRFIRDNIRMTIPIRGIDKSMLIQYHFDALIVGSDQVWRPTYSRGIYNYFLDFAEKWEVKKVAYAASFGVDEWEYSDEQTFICKRLIQLFDAISVREESGVELCDKYLGVEAVRVLDPTLLLERNIYEGIVEKDVISQKNRSLMVYILDKSPQKDNLVTMIARILELNPNCVMPQYNYADAGKKVVDKCIFPAVTNWLRGFMDAEYVITDSFHGTVFSIIFNKPFIAISNRKRGTARFDSLLGLLGLKSRLIMEDDIMTENFIKAPIDYSKVNRILKKEKERSISFLREALL